MGRRRSDDDDDDGYAPRSAGRPRAPEAFGPPRPEPYDRREYRARLQAILDAIEIPDLDIEVRRYLQRTLRMYDVLRTHDPRRFTIPGEEVVILRLRVVFESTNGAAALTLPILRAVSGCMSDAWVAQGLRLIEAYDEINLVALHAQLLDLGLEDQLERVIRARLTAILDLRPPKPEEKPRRGTGKPAGASQESWNAVLDMMKKDRHARAKKRLESKRPAAMAA
jgi:hypothetical protein